MPPGTGLRGAVQEVARRASAVVRLQAELAKTELAQTGKNAGVGAGLAFGAAFVGVFVFALLTTLFVVSLAIVLPLWLSVLIVLIVYLIVAVVLLAVARNFFRQAKGVPLAKEQARLTAGALGRRRDGDGEAASAPALPTEPPSEAVGSPPAQTYPARDDAGG